MDVLCLKMDIQKQVFKNINVQVVQRKERLGNELKNAKEINTDSASEY